MTITTLCRSGPPGLRVAAIALVAIVSISVLHPQAPAEVIEAEFQLPAEAFDQWVFQKIGTRRVAAIHLHDLLELRIAAVDAACKLTDPQRRKLALAGKIDIRQLFDRVESVRKVFLAVRRDQDAFNKAEIWQRTAPLQAAVVGGVFGAESLYRKVLANTLTADQQTAWEKVQQERRRYAYEAKIRLTLVALEPGLPLTEAQRQGLIELLLEQTTPPLRTGPYEQHYVLYQFGQLEIRDLARWLTLAQLRTLRDRVRDFPEAERNFLKEQGLAYIRQEALDTDEADTRLNEADDRALEAIGQQLATEEQRP